MPCDNRTGSAHIRRHPARWGRITPWHVTEALIGECPGSENPLAKSAALAVAPSQRQILETYASSDRHVLGPAPHRRQHLLGERLHLVDEIRREGHEDEVGHAGAGVALDRVETLLAAADRDLRTRFGGRGAAHRRHQVANELLALGCRSVAEGGAAPISRCGSRRGRRRWRGAR